MRSLLILLFAFMFVFMMVMAARSQIEISFWDFRCWRPRPTPTLGRRLRSGPPTLQSRFFVSVCYKPASLDARILRVALMEDLRDIAMPAYVLIQLFRLRQDEPVSNVITPRA